MMMQASDDVLAGLAHTALRPNDFFCWTMAFFSDEASFYTMVDTFLSIPIESQCCQSYGVCGAQFETDVAFDE